MKLSEAVRDIIRLGDASRAYWDRELRRHHPHYPMIHPGEDEPPPPPEDAQIQAVLNSLSEDQLYSLILLMYVGRGNYRTDQLPSAYQAMKESFPSKELIIGRMTGDTWLAADLADAMEQIKKHHIDPDNLKLTGAVSVS
jgi:hypothetical protein